MYQRRQQSRDATHRFCVHHEGLALVEEMEPLSSGEPSDCCRECWSKIKTMMDEVSLFFSRKWIADAEREGARKYVE
jgi:hypothetical protein